MKWVPESSTNSFKHTRGTECLAVIVFCRGTAEVLWHHPFAQFFHQTFGPATALRKPQMVRRPRAALHGSPEICSRFLLVYSHHSRPKTPRPRGPQWTMQRDPTQDNSSSLLLSALISFHAWVNLLMWTFSPQQRLLTETAISKLYSFNFRAITDRSLRINLQRRNASWIFVSFWLNFVLNAGLS